MRRIRCLGSHAMRLIEPCRSCVGRNLANLELLIIIASILRRYDFVLEDPEKPVSEIFRCAFT